MWQALFIPPTKDIGHKMAALTAPGYFVTFKHQLLNTTDHQSVENCGACIFHSIPVSRAYDAASFWVPSSKKVSLGWVPSSKKAQLGHFHHFVLHLQNLSEEGSTVFCKLHTYTL